MRQNARTHASGMRRSLGRMLTHSATPTRAGEQHELKHSQESWSLRKTLSQITANRKVEVRKL
jgi:hypothetical protein